MLKNLTSWDNENVKKIIFFIKKYNASFIDCGCNFGAYSIPIAKKFKNQNIYAFDASKKAINNLRQNIALNKIKNINYFNIGIGDKKTEMYFNEEISDLRNDGSYRFTKGKQKEKIKISKMLLDNSSNFFEEFALFVKKNKLNIYDLNLKNKNVDEVIKLLKSINSRNETIGDYIISNHKLL